MATACAPAGEVRLAIEAMATRFELVLAGSDPAWLRGAGEEALAEIARLAHQLNFYCPASEVTWINACAAHGPVQVEPGLFDLLRRCRRLSEATDGAFDITVGPLVRLWRQAGRDGAVPDERSLAAAREAAGYRHLELDAAARTVRFRRPGMSIDLGAAGKGYAIDRAIEVLRGLGVERALLHGGTSSVHALGAPERGAWTIEWRPRAGQARTFDLRDGALSVSAGHGRVFDVDGRAYGHVVDPRTGWPTETAVSAVVTGPRSCECDALSTAALAGGGGLGALRARFPGYECALG
ncbi:MAG TPA: FAD:protein FMN transferase [Vicinamibacterales bacterium]|nr:FAD:protein FMN transferase [Vicinamibacterales bacterium]